QLLGPTVLTDAGTPVPAVVIGVNDETRSIERPDERTVASRVFANTVQKLHHTARRSFCFVDVEDDRHAVRVDELTSFGHGSSLRMPGAMAQNFRTRGPPSRRTLPSGR